MLLERAAGLAAKINQYEKLKGTAHEAAQFKTRADQFGAIAERMDRTTAALSRFAQAKIAVGFAFHDPALIERTRTLRTAIEQDPNAIGDPPFDLKYEFADRLYGLCEAAGQAMLQAWQAYVRDAAQSSSDEILNALSALPQFRQTIGRIRQCRMEIQSMFASVPEDVAAGAKRIGELVEAQRTAWAELSASDIPPAVIAFLKACGGDGAPLSALSDDVRAWLEARKLLGAFRILIR